MAGAGNLGNFAVDLGDWFETHAAEIKADLEQYFLGVGGPPLNGRHFERFSAMGDPNRFTATDILAVEALSVGVPPNSAAKLLDTEAEDFNLLLRQIPADKHMWEVPRYVLADNGPAGKLHARLQKLDRVGWVTAGKLMASKRPLLIPILDNFVKKVLKPPPNRFWSAMREQLSDEQRRRRIKQVVSFPLGDVTFLRRIDVAVWMHAYRRRTTSQAEMDIVYTPDCYFGVLFAERDVARRAAELWRAVAESTTWGEFRRRIHPDDWAEIAEQLDDRERDLPPEDAPFSADDLPVWGDDGWYVGLWPPEESVRWFPQALLDRYDGHTDSDNPNRDQLFLPSEYAEEIAEELRAGGHRVEKTVTGDLPEWLIRTGYRDPD